MRLKLGAIVTELHGSLNGHTAETRRAGTVLRNRLKPLRQLSTTQQTLRQRIKTLSRTWTKGTQAERGVWNSLAMEYFSRRPGNRSLKVTGRELFIRAALVRLRMGLAATLNVTTPVAPMTPTTLTVNANAALNRVRVQYAPAQITGQNMTVWATPALSAGITQVKKYLRIINQRTGAAASPFDCGTQWEAKFGNLVSGMIIHVRVTCDSNMVGLRGFDQTFRVVVS